MPSTRTNHANDRLLASAQDDDDTAARIDAMAEAIAKACPIRPYTVEADEIERLNRLAAEYRRSAAEIRRQATATRDEVEAALVSRINAEIRNAR
jgi:hypothetical protein